MWHCILDLFSIRHPSSSGHVFNSFSLPSLMEPPEPYDDLYHRAMDYHLGGDLCCRLMRARRLLRKAYALGNAKAANMLGYYYEHGIGVCRSEGKAFQYYLEAASRGLPIAEYNVGVMLSWRGRHEEAIKWWSIAAEHGETNALSAIGECYETGRGVARDIATAIRYYSDASSKGNADGIARLAFCYREGRGVERDMREAIRLVESSRDSNHPWILCELGWLYYNGYIEAEEPAKIGMQYYHKAALLGWPDAQEFCGEMYVMYGKGDMQEGVGFLRKAVQANQSRAKYIMAVMLAEGRGVKQNSRKAFHLCREAAEAGEPSAQYMLGMMLERGDGVRRNDAKALEWFERAARAGNERAISRLKDMGISG